LARHGRLLAFALIAVACGRRPDAARVPMGTPVVLISVDTLRADHLPAYGYAGVATPALDRSARGLRSSSATPGRRPR
jgi:hypothetical protein